MSEPLASKIGDFSSDPLPWWKRHEDYVAAAVVFFFTVLLAVVSFPPFPAPEFAYVLAVPAIIWSYRRPAFKLFALTLGAAQVVAWTILLFWLKEVSWLALSLLAPFVGVWVGVWYLAVWWAMPRFAGRSLGLRIAGMLALGGLWVLLEWTRHWFLTGFPWLPLSASQWQRPMMLQIASYTGAYGISFILVVFNIGFGAYAHRLFFEKVRGLKRRSPEFMVSMTVLVFMAFLPFREMMGQQREPLAKVAFVQPYIAQEVKWDPARAQSILNTLEQLTVKAGETRPDLILWPESVMPMFVNVSPEMRDWVEKLSKRVRAPILMGADAVQAPPAGSDKELIFNGAFVVHPDSGLKPVFYAKRKLVPFGEYVPFRPLFGWLKKIVPISDGDFDTGVSADPLVLETFRGDIRAGVLICYEDIFPALSRESVQAGAEVLTVLTNNAWFGEGAAAYQHAAHSVLRAVETRRPVLRIGNGGWSGWIDEYGYIRGKLENKEKSVYIRGTRTIAIMRDIRWMGRPSLYTHYGDWFVVAAAAFVAFGWAALGLTSPTEKVEEGESPEPAA